jgi:hypothetical protein
LCAILQQSYGLDTSSILRDTHAVVVGNQAGTRSPVAASDALGVTCGTIDRMSIIQPHAPSSRPTRCASLHCFVLSFLHNQHLAEFMKSFPSCQVFMMLVLCTETTDQSVESC